MDDEPRRVSAKIYRFPPTGVDASRRKAKPTSSAGAAPAPSGRGWYHDVAIRDAGEGRGPERRE